MNLADFTDASELLGGGVFVLLDRGEVVFVGRASGPMLPRIAALRASERPKFLARIPFDQVLIRRVHPDRAEALRATLIATHRPKFNEASPATAPLRLEPLCVFERRI